MKGGNEILVQRRELVIFVIYQNVLIYLFVSLTNALNKAVSFQYLLGKEETAQCKVEMAKQLNAPVEKKVVVGTVTYELDGAIIEQFKIYTAEAVEKATFWNKVKKWLKIAQDFVGNLIKK